MNQKNAPAPGATKCRDCPLRKMKRFRDFNQAELAFVTRFKSGELSVAPKATVMAEGAPSPHLFTVLSGWGFRYKFLEDGRRQVLNYVMPGDLAGLQGSLMGEMQHSVETLTPMTLCVFERAEIMELFRSHPELAYDITWIAAREEQMLDEHLLSVGRRSALERASYLLAFLYRRAQATGLLKASRRTLPITQTHIADTLGLSLVHTNKTLRKLARRGLIQWHDSGCDVRDDKALAAIAKWEDGFQPQRPFI